MKMQHKKPTSKFVLSSSRHAYSSNFREKIYKYVPLFTLASGVVGGVMLATLWLPSQADLNIAKDEIRKLTRESTVQASEGSERNKGLSLKALSSFLVKPTDTERNSTVKRDAGSSVVGTELPDVFIAGISNPARAADELANGFSLLASADDASVSRWAMNLLSTNMERIENHLALLALLQDWAIVDANAAIEELIKSLNDSLSEFDLVARKRVLAQLVNELPQSSDILYSKLGESNLSQVQLSTTFSALMEIDADRAQAVADHVVEVYGVDATQTLMRDWIQADATTALTWLNTAPESLISSDVRERAMSLLSEQDPQAALSLAESLEPDQGRLASIQFVLENMLSKDPDAVRDYIDTLPDTRDGRELVDRLVLSVAREMGQKDPLAAISWAQQKDLAIADDLVEAILIEWHATDSVAATSWADANLDQHARTQIIERSLSQQLTNDPQTAERIYSGLDFNTRANHASMFGEQLELEYPGAGRKWVETITDPIEKGYAEQGILQAMVYTDPESAIALSLNIDSDLRTEVLLNLVQIHGGENPQLIQQLIDDPNVDDITREQILNLQFSIQEG